MFSHLPCYRSSASRTGLLITVSPAITAILRPVLLTGSIWKHPFDNIIVLISMCIATSENTDMYGQRWFKSACKFEKKKTKKKKTSYSEQQRRWSRMRRLICAFVVRTYIKAGFLSDSRHRSSTSCTTFVWTALQWRTNIIYTHWNIVSTFVRGWIRNWIVVKVTFSKTVRGNEEWQIEYDGPTSNTHNQAPNFLKQSEEGPNCLIRIFTERISDSLACKDVYADNKNSDQTVRKVHFLALRFMLLLVVVVRAGTINRIIY